LSFILIIKKPRFRGFFLDFFIWYYGAEPVSVGVSFFDSDTLEFVCWFCCLTFTVELVFSIAGLAPQASYFSVSSNRKVTKRMPPTSLALRVPEFSAIAYEPALMRRPGAQG